MTAGRGNRKNSKRSLYQYRFGYYKSYTNCARFEATTAKNFILKSN
jgi:hypothetical protein